MSETVQVIMLCALILPVVGALLARSKNPRLPWIARAVTMLGQLAGVLIGLIVLLVIVLIVYLAWQFSR